MVQGAPKKSAKADSKSTRCAPRILNAHSSHKQAENTRPTTRRQSDQAEEIKAGRKEQTDKSASLHADSIRLTPQKHSAGMAAMTEKKLAERAGHLELLKGGKKTKKDAQKPKGK
jgi:hypothetical protein